MNKKDGIEQIESLSSDYANMSENEIDFLHGIQIHLRWLRIEQINQHKELMQALIDMIHP